MLSYVLLFAVEVYHLFIKRIFTEHILTLRKINKYAEIMVWSVLFFVDNSLTYFIVKDAWFNSMISFALLLITLFLLYNNSILSICITSAFMLIAGILSEFVTVYGWIFITGQNWEGVQNDSNNVGLMIISKIILFLIIKLFIVLIQKKENSQVCLQDWIEIFLVPLGSTVILYAIFYNKENMDNPLNVVAVCSVLVINVLTYNLYEKTKVVTEQRIREEMLKEESLYYIRQYNDNEKIWNDLWKFRHNIKEQYITQKIMLENKEYEKLDKMFDDVLHITSSKVNVSNTGNIYFDSIINFKATIADSFGIQIKLDAIIPTNASVDVEDINLCLGNLLDNAIEALKTFDGDKVIDLQLKSEEGNLWISISNSCQDKTIKKEGKYITTKNDSKWHGLGLSIIKGIVDKYDGDMRINEEQGKFTVKILMYEILR